jgi:hypothetical protein
LIFASRTRDLLNVLDTVGKAGAGFKSLADTWADTTTPHGRLMLTVLGGLAEFERELIRSRTGEGRKRAMARGVRFGRPPKLTHQRQEAGGSNHLACMLLNSTIGIEVTHVPYRNVVQGLQEVMAGRMDYDCVSLPLALPQIAGKTVKPIAILSKARSLNLPDLPSAHEQGLTNLDLPSWYALFLPAKTPQPIIQRLNRATVAALEMPSLQQHLKQVGGDVIAPEGRSPEYLAQFVADEIKKWEGPIKASGVSF